MTDYPLVPPPELVCQWKEQWYKAKVKHHDEYAFVATQAARWGSDQELDACCKFLTHSAAWEPEDVKEFRDARRPELPSFKKQALDALYAIATGADDTREFYQDIETIKTALEQLDD